MELLTRWSSVQPGGPGRPFVTYYDVATGDGQQPTAQRAIGAHAVAAGLTLISAAEISLDLEQVFLRLVDPKERAA